MIRIRLAHGAGGIEIRLTISVAEDGQREIQTVPPADFRRVLLAEDACENRIDVFGVVAVIEQRFQVGV